MKETFYFSHDYNARTDTKIRNLIRKHKLLGYGIYWSIIEDLYQNANALPMDCEGIAFDLHTDKKTIQSVICDFDLFVIKDGFFGSMSVQRRLDERNAKSNKAREIAMKRWNPDANALPPQSQGTAIKESKGKESKGEKEIMFDSFWLKYPNKVAKQKCKDKFLKLPDSDVEMIMATLDSFITHKPFPNYNHPNPETYLNQKRWQDEITVKQSSTSGQTIADTLFESRKGFAP